MRGFDEVSLRLRHPSLDSENRYLQLRQNRPPLCKVPGGQGDAAPAAAISGMFDPQ